ncbi:MAG: hypothetical protein WAM30_21465, partial [Candidatus Dormiibacterota bacterium]
MSEDPAPPPPGEAGGGGGPTGSPPRTLVVRALWTVAVLLLPLVVATATVALTGTLRGAHGPAPDG